MKTKELSSWLADRGAGALVEHVPLKAAGVEGAALVRTEDDVQNLWHVPLEGGEPEQLTGFDEDRIREFAWSPDGARLVVSRGRVDNDIVLLKNFR